MSRVIGYVDGFNLYYGLRERRWRQYYWIDPHKLIAAILSPGHQLVAAKYFTARIKGPHDKRRRQTSFLDALNAVSEVEVIHGRYYRKEVACHTCKASWTSHEEKMTDSAIASHLVADAFLDSFDIALLVGGDTDIVPAIKMVRRHFPKKRLVVWFPPARRNQEVERNCDDCGMINGSHLSASMMPDSITFEGVTIARPASWR